MQSIRVENLKKSYGTVHAVKGVSFAVNKGEIFGLIGPDGAGKTTILRSVVSLLVPDSGRVLFQDREVAAETEYVRRHVGYMPQRFSLYQDLTVEQNLRFFGDLFQVPKSEQVTRMEQLYRFSRLEPFRDRLAGNLSGGMKQKLALSCMLMHEPGVVVLDEPTLGVDPVSRSEFWEILHALSDRGIALLITTAYMDEASQCDRVGLILEGEILAQERPEKLVSEFRIPLYLIHTEHPHEVFRLLQESSFASDVQLFGNGVHFLDRRGSGLDALKALLKSAGSLIQDYERIKPTLENVFLNLMMSTKNE